MKSSHSYASRIGVLAAFLMAPAAAAAHPIHSPGMSFSSGFFHPFSGLDHIAAMLGIGLFASQYARGRMLAIIAFATSGVVVGGALGHLAGAIPFVDQAIAASVVTVALLLIRTNGVSWPVGAAAATAFSLFHGLAHGAEMPFGNWVLPYAAGFLLSSVILLCCGSATLALQPERRMSWLRYGGYALLACSIALVLV